MNRLCIFIATLPALAATSCAPPFDYDKATREERIAYLDATSKGMYDGLEKTLPRGGPAQIYAYMGGRDFDPDARLVEITVDVRSGGENITTSSNDKQKMVRAMCALYDGNELERNDITLSIHYEMPGGGTALAFRINKDRCAEFKEQAA
jgi:hypothetical protein